MVSISSAGKAKADPARVKAKEQRMILPWLCPFVPRLLPEDAGTFEVGLPTLVKAIEGILKLRFPT